MEYIGFWRRFAAIFIDGIVLGVVSIPINVIFPAQKISENATMPNPMATVLGLVLSLLYWVVWQHKMGQTLGKKAMGIKVVDVNGKTPTYMTFFLREIVGKLISGIILGIGYLMVIWDSKKQGLHDKIASTYVVKA